MKSKLLFSLVVVMAFGVVAHADEDDSYKYGGGGDGGGGSHSNPQSPGTSQQRPAQQQPTHQQQPAQQPAQQRGGQQQQQPAQQPVQQRGAQQQQQPAQQRGGEQRGGEQRYGGGEQRGGDDHRGGDQRWGDDHRGGGQRWGDDHRGDDHRGDDHRGNGPEVWTYGHPGDDHRGDDRRWADVPHAGGRSHGDYDGQYEVRAREVERLRIEERNRWNQSYSSYRENFFRAHAEVRSDWRWQWRGNGCGYYAGPTWTPYGIEYCRAAIGSRYFWLNGGCREYTTVGIYIGVVEVTNCGGEETRTYFGWNGGFCYEYDIWNRPLVAIDNGFCAAQYGTHYGWFNGYCAELTNESNILVRYATDANGYSDLTPCTVGALEPFLKTSTSVNAVALEDGTGAKSGLPPEVASALSDGRPGKLATSIQ